MGCWKAEGVGCRGRERLVAASSGQPGSMDIAKQRSGLGTGGYPTSRLHPTWSLLPMPPFLSSVLFRKTHHLGGSVYLAYQIAGCAVIGLLNVASKMFN